MGGYIVGCRGWVFFNETRPSGYSDRNERLASFASTRWRDRCLAVAELRRRSGELTALRRRNTTDTHSRLKPLLYVLLTLSYKLALIAIRSALCTLHSAHLSLHTSHRQRRPAERKFGTAPIAVATRPAATGLHASAATSYVTMTRSQAFAPDQIDLSH